MKRARWRNRHVPPVIFLTAAIVGLAAPAGVAIGIRTAAAAQCPDQSPSAFAQSALEPGGASSTTAHVDSQIDETGELTGQQLELQSDGGVSVSIALPVESSVSPAFGELIVYTRHSPEAGSEVRAVNLSGACDELLARPAQIVRSAILDVTASGVYVHSVTAGDRSDNGVHRYDLGSGAVTAIVAPLIPTEAFGPIFGTELQRSVGGDGLAVQSCGFAACVTRVHNIATGAVRLFDFVGQGQIIGLTRSNLVTYADCHGLPCPVLSIDLDTGTVITLAEEAFGATLTHSSLGRGRLLIETAAGIVEVAQ